MGEVLLFTVSVALGIAVPAWIVRRDLTRLTGEALSRAWPDASLWAAAVLFGPLCLPVHFMKTRRNWRGLALGVAWFAGALLLIILPVELLGWLFGVSE